MTPLVDLTGLVVRQRRQLMGVTVGYDLFDPQGGAVGSVVQVGRDDLDRTVRPRADAATMALAGSLGVPADHAYLLTPFEVRTTVDDVVLRIVHLKQARSTVMVCGPDGVEIARIVQENLVAKVRFGLLTGDQQVGTIVPTSWRQKGWSLTDVRGLEVADIAMTRGTSGDRTDANDYTVERRQPLEDPMRSLSVAGAIAVDLVVWQRHR